MMGSSAVLSKGYPMSEETLFHEARDRTPAQRAAYLEGNCPDPEMRRRIEGLLQAHDAAGGVLDRPALTDVFTPPPGDGDASTMAAEQAGDRIGPYKLLQKLGEGGMGTVWVAEQSVPVKRPVALKLIKAGMDSAQVLRRFEAERQALALMDHQHIARVLDAGTTPLGRPYFAMELIKGIPITKYCDRAHLNPRERLELFIPVCQAVQHAHQKGVIHRDLKPSNVLVALYDGKPVPKVIDFGVAKATSQKLTEQTMYTEVGQIVGTLEYMAPEQAELNNLDIDTRADIYSLGVILYELLAGSPPFTAGQLRGAAFTEMLRMIREVEPPKPSTRLSSSDELPSIAANRKLEPNRLTRLVHGDLDWIVMKALAKDRGRRYETANGFAVDILRYLADEPVSAGPPSAAYRLRKLVQRNKGRVLAAAAVALAIVASVSAIVVVQALANRELAGKNDQLAAKNTELAEEEAKVQARFDLAQQAIETFDTVISKEVLLEQDQFKELRDKLLQEAARFYGQLEKLLEGQTDRRSRRALAAGYFELGELTEKIGAKPEALAVHQKALAVRRELADAADADAETRLDVARSLLAVGGLLCATGDKTGALAAFREGRNLAEQLDGQNSTDAIRAVLANGHSLVGLVFWETGKPTEALEAHEEARIIRMKLADAHPADTQFQRDLGNSCLCIGHLLSQRGKPAEALLEFEKARTIRLKLAAAHPADMQFQRDLGNSHLNIGVVLAQTDKPAEALAEYEKARAIYRKAAAANPAVSQFQRDLANSHHEIGALLADMGKPAEALAATEQALAIRQKLTADNPSVIEFQSDLAFSHQAMGDRLSDMGMSTKALAEYEQAQVIRQQLADANPAVTQLQSRLAGCHNNIGWLLSHTGKPTAALVAYEKARAINQKLADANPDVIGFQNDLANSNNNIGWLCARQKRFADAYDALERSFAIGRKLTHDHPENFEYSSGLGESHAYRGWARAHDGRPADAAVDLRRAIELWAKAPTLDLDVRFERCRALALLAWLGDNAKSGVTEAEAAVFADQAVAALRDAVKSGWSHPDELTDPDFDPLRGREDFKKLLAELDNSVKERMK
jgi:serine/threonine protein kinase/tetratricopeptide (TPR) repeat protein